MAIIRNNISHLVRRDDNDGRPRDAGARLLRVHLVGRMRAIAPTGEDILPRGLKTQATLAYLLLAGGQHLQRSRIAGLIWDRSGEAQARDSLRQALNKIKRVGGWQLERRRDTTRLSITNCWIDVLQSPEHSDPLLEELEGVSPSFDHWLIGERARYENRWQQTLEETLGRLVEDSAGAQSRLEAARNLLTFVPTHEGAIRALMTALVELGDRTQAIREYERFRIVVDNLLGALPSETTTELYQKVRWGLRPNVDRPATPARAAHPAVTFVPAADDEAIGTAKSIRVAERGRQPSIAVLPLANLSMEPGRGVIAAGLTEDLVEALSRVSGVMVVSRLSSAAFKSRNRPPPEIGAALGVRYILSGSVRASGDRLRLVVELTEAETSHVLCIERFEERFSDPLIVQNQLADAVVRAVAPLLHAAEMRRLRAKRPEDYTAYELFLSAQDNMHNPSRTVFERSERLLTQAIARDPDYAAAHAWRAYWHVMRVGQGWSPNPATDTDLADYFADRAMECDRLEPMGFAVKGHVAAYLHKDFDAAFASFEKALQLNPNSPRAWLWSASARAWTGDGPGAVNTINQAMALSPYDPLISAYTASASMAYLADGQYGRAIDFAKRSTHENRAYTSPHKLLIMSLALAGRETEARSRLYQLLALEPDFTVERFRRRFPGSETEIGERCCEALARAGVRLAD